MAKVTIKTFKEALKNSGGNQARIAEKLEVTRSAIGHFLKKNPKMRELLEAEAEYVLDIIEDNITVSATIHKDVADGKWILTNSKRGKARGWGVKQEIEHSGEQSITFQEVIMSDETIKKMKEESIMKIKDDKKNNLKPKAK